LAKKKIPSKTKGKTTGIKEVEKQPTVWEENYVNHIYRP
jgi:hypothetical protein